MYGVRITVVRFLKFASVQIQKNVGGQNEGNVGKGEKIETNCRWWGKCPEIQINAGDYKIDKPLTGYYDNFLCK